MINTNLTPKSASQFQQQQIQQRASVLVAKKSLDAQRAQGDAAIELLQQAEQLAQQAAAQISSGRVDVVI
ncbi:MAG: hypothetical protein KatS3mg111_2719 [Pirellulaceae bacterium]|nr:MAG: hypothetical protein KatS3mg111_2719 [Pirellulaceae bacterium]